MSRKYFGTDGIRGRVGVSPITPEFVMHLGYAAGRVLTGMDSHLAPGAHPTVLIGKDTRISGYMLESALQAGLCAAGVNVLLTGPLPTPAIAYLTRALRAQAGIVISASHNPFEDNGIKFFSAEGTKLDDEIELAIEAALDKPIQVMESAIGKVKRIDDAAGRYIEFCKSTFPTALDLRGLKIVLDCAHGATYHVAPPVFHELGAEVVAIGNRPNGTNINDQAGSTHPEALCKAVIEQQADLGIAFDGDGDRVVMVDANGQVLDGDQLLYIIAMHRQQQGKLAGGVVGTLMTNLALEHALAKADIPFLRAKVGDRYVLELLNEHDWQLGGENSGHILSLDKHSSGDGIIAALQVLHAVVASKKTLAEFGASLTLYPQILINVAVAKR
ncbi:MAG: phosphoglucosamine mutase, partial [Methylophilaceae bacterium]